MHFPRDRFYVPALQVAPCKVTSSLNILFQPCMNCDGKSRWPSQAPYVAQTLNMPSAKICFAIVLLLDFSTVLESKIENFFGQAFRVPPGYPSKNPGISRKKVWFPWVSKDIPNFLARTPSRGRPPPHPKILFFLMYGVVTLLGDRFLSSAGTGRNFALSMRVPNPSPVLDKNPAPMGPEILSRTGAGVWSKAPKAFPDSSSVLGKFQSASYASQRRRRPYGSLSLSLSLSSSLS